MRWDDGDCWAELRVDLAEHDFRLSWGGPDGQGAVEDAAGLEELPAPRRA